MAAAISHRGPDDSGTWCDSAAGIAFGHRRLTVIDLAPSGSQPMRSTSGRYVIAYNGEVYNYAEIRKELRARGRTFRGASDTEVVVEAIDEWGVEMATQRFVGMFAFAVWDRRSRSLALVRDRLGIKPLYWGQLGKAFIFGSELKALQRYDDWDPTIDVASFADFLRWNFIPAPRSIYRGINKLQPGTILIVKPGSSPQIKSYWSLRSVVSDSKTSAEYSQPPEEGFEELLRCAVRTRMVADVPVGAFLSGGLDSSTVVALMREYASSRLKTFTIGFDEESFDEVPYAREVAKRLETDHTEHYLHHDEVAALIPKITSIYDEPFADSSQLPTYLVSELARREVKVVLTGDGGDELLGGYTRYYQAKRIWQLQRALPAGFWRAFASAANFVTDDVWRVVLGPIFPRMSADQRIKRLRLLVRFLQASDLRDLHQLQHQRWQADVLLQHRRDDGTIALWDEPLPSQLTGIIERLRFLDSVTYLPDDILTKVDRASMAVGLEARVPLLDHRLVEFSWRTRPPALSKDPKRLLKHVIGKRLPTELFDRRKMGFGVPLQKWLRGPLREWAEDLLSADSLRRDGLLNVDPIRRAWSDLSNGKLADHEALWGILVFQSWRQSTAETSKSEPNKPA